MSAYYWLTYIDKSVTSGEAYGFKIGASKTEIVDALNSMQREFPKAHVYIFSEKKTGDSFSISVPANAFEKFGSYDMWTILLDCEGQFFNSFALHFENDRLVKIYRHRQNFELP